MQKLEIAPKMSKMTSQKMCSNSFREKKQKQLKRKLNDLSKVGPGFNLR